MSASAPVPRLPKYRKQTNRDYAFVEWKGKRYKLPGKWESKQSISAYQEFLRVHVLSPTPSIPSLDKRRVVLVNDLILHYLRHASTFYQTDDGSPSTEFAWVKCVMKKLSTAHGNEAIERMRPTLIKSFRLTLGQTMTRQGVNRVVGVVKRMLRWGAEEELISGELAAAIILIPPLKYGKGGTEERPKVAAVKFQVFRATLRYLPPALRSLLRIMYYTGCRPQSACNMHWGEIEKEGDVWKWRALSKMRHIGQGLELHLGKRAQRVLRKYEGRQGYLFSPTESCPKNKRYRKKYNSRTLGQAVAIAAKRASLPHWTPNQLRHLAATEISTRYGVEAARIALGHSSMVTTAIYAEKDMNVSKEIARNRG